jgi:uncharacterized protein involved in outer membrane biogenesis
MARPLRIALLIAALLAALLMLALLSAWLLFDPEQARKQLQGRLSDALGMDVRIGQPPAFGLSGSVSVTLADLEVSRQGQVVATAETAHVRIALLSLLAGDVRPIGLHLQRPVISIERSGPGVFNVYPTETEAGARNGLSLQRVRVSAGRLTYRDRPSGAEWLFEHCDLELRDIRYAMPARTRASLGADGELKCQRVSHERFAISGLSAQMQGDRGVFVVDVLDGQALDGRIAARLDVDLASSPSVFRLSGSLSRFDAGAFMAMLGPTRDTRGSMDLELQLDAQGGSWAEVRGSAAGSISIAAAELTIAGYDLDDELDGYAATQRFNLVDAGAVLLAGPFGLVASRGYAFSGLLEGSSGSTRIVELVSNWTVEGGIAQARDVAFRTPGNRLALAGGLDFTRYRFQELQVAVVDRDGCAIVEQTISGPFRAPELKQPNFLLTVAGPLIDLLKRGMKAVAGRECEAFYSGSVAHP